MKDFIRKKGIYIAIAAVLVAIVSSITVAFGSSGGDLASILSSPVLKPVKTAMSSLVNSLEKAYDYIYKYDQLVLENEELKKQVAVLEEEYREYIEISDENERLRQLLNLSERHSDYKYETASIISWSSSNFSSSFTINKGKNDGIALNDCIVTETHYLVGRVTEVTATSATVTTIIDTTMNIGTIISENGEPAVLMGDFELFREGLVKLSYLQAGSDILIGDTIVTSGDGGIYPKGLVIGEVQDVVITSSGLDNYAVINPAAEIGDLTHVFVITDFEIEE